MNQDPLTIVVVAAIAFYIGKVWYEDYRNNIKGTPSSKPLPGATPVGLTIIVVGLLLALVLVLVETAGEYRLGISSEQSTVTWLFLLGMLSAGFLEEVIFRGFLVVENRGPTALVGSILLFSAVFAIAHLHWVVWKGPDNGWLELRLTTAAGWWTLVVFLNALLFYALRFCPWNSKRSLIPCFIAHMGSNAAVFAIKYGQGFVGSLY